MSHSRRYASPWGRLAAMSYSAAQHSLSERAFVVSIGSLLLFGILVTAVSSTLFPGSLPGWACGLFGLLMVFAGVETSVRNQEWKGSLIGLMISHLGLGAMIGPFATDFTSWPIRSLTLLSIGILILTLIGWTRPSAIRGWGSFLLAAVLAAGLGMSLPLTITLGDILAATSALAFLDYYWTRALDLPRTLDNAVDSACAVYLDVFDQAFRLIERFSNPNKPTR